MLAERKGACKVEGQGEEKKNKEKRTTMTFRCDDSMKPDRGEKEREKKGKEERDVARRRRLEESQIINDRKERENTRERKEETEGRGSLLFFARSTTEVEVRPRSSEQF